jgi:D-glycero-alpha-D-manno-heptose 1-phosphate guanylyltransferase
MSDITAVILAGGKGTRLRSVVPDLPKCLAEVNGKPFIFYILDQLVEIKVKRIVLAVNYMGDMVQAIVGTKYKGIPIYYSYDTIKDGGTGHALRAAIVKADTSKILVMNGDTYVSIKLSNFIWHVHYGSDCNNGLVLNVLNGPTNMGIYLFNKDIIKAYIPSNEICSIENQFLSRLNSPEVYVISTPYIDIGTPESYAKANEFMYSVV